MAEEEFRNIDDVCRYYGLSKEWYYSLRRAVKIRRRLDHDTSGLPVSTLSLIERSNYQQTGSRGSHKPSPKSSYHAKP
ncbi:MAG: hypothetical protein NXY59_01805 [Aigarchaeota archaeon]|nr:hypothetical protein [Candidatus Pelearchaeum maunauluense]